VREINNPRDYIGNRAHYNQLFAVDDPKFINGAKFRMKSPK